MGWEIILRKVAYRGKATGWVLVLQWALDNFLYHTDANSLEEFYQHMLLIYAENIKMRTNHLTIIILYVQADLSRKVLLIPINLNVQMVRTVPLA